MKIAVIQATTQINKNKILFEETKRAAINSEIFNFGVKAEEGNLSYVQVSLLIGLLINSESVDFVITGCSSGNGMAIAANSLPNVICGYLPTPADAYLFGRINRGNCASLPLGLNYGWGGELNIRFILEKLFEFPMNIGYPKSENERKRIDSENVLKIKRVGQTNILKIISELPSELTKPIFLKSDVISFICKNSKNEKISEYLKSAQIKYNEK